MLLWLYVVRLAHFLAGRVENVRMFCMSEILEKLFGSKARVKILRLFLFNPHDSFSASRISDQTGVQGRTARSNAKRLESIGFLYAGKVEPRSKHASKKKVTAWQLNHGFPYRDALHSLLIRSELFDTEVLREQIEAAGNIQVLLLAGVFLHHPSTRIDICVVGEDLDKEKIEKTIQEFEQDIGTELRYAVLTTSDFEYRHGMYDRFVRDVLEHPHEPIIDKLGITQNGE